MRVGENQLTFLGFTWANGIDVPVGFICCSIGANICPMGVAITFKVEMRNKKSAQLI